MRCVCVCVAVFRVDKKRDKLDRQILDSQERAFWDVHRPAVSSFPVDATLARPSPLWKLARPPIGHSTPNDGSHVSTSPTSRICPLPPRRPRGDRHVICFASFAARSISPAIWGCERPRHPFHLYSVAVPRTRAYWLPALASRCNLKDVMVGDKAQIDGIVVLLLLLLRTGREGATRHLTYTDDDDDDD